MERGGLSILFAAMLLAGCAEPEVVTEAPAAPDPLPVVVAEPPAPRSLTLPERIRQEAWITRFWEQLTPGQRRRVASQLRRTSPPLVEVEAEAAPIWDALGLPDRDALMFGAGLAQPPAPAD
jgi:hypothetical protein